MKSLKDSREDGVNFKEGGFMDKMTEIQICEASSVYGGKNAETAELVTFIAECIGSIAKMIYLANQFRKMFINPAAM